VHGTQSRTKEGLVLMKKLYSWKIDQTNEKDVELVNYLCDLKDQRIDLEPNQKLAIETVLSGKLFGYDTLKLLFDAIWSGRHFDSDKGYQMFKYVLWSIDSQQVRWSEHEYTDAEKESLRDD
jgi:hypothetical protein